MSSFKRIANGRLFICKKKFKKRQITILSAKRIAEILYYRGEREREYVKTAIFNVSQLVPENRFNFDARAKCTCSYWVLNYIVIEHII